MALESIHLRKLLQLFYASAPTRRRLLLADIREELRRGEQDEAGGGHFHLPFWTDVRRHVAGEADLTAQTNIRIRSNPRRRRLYPLLADAFLLWAHEKRRTRNEPISLISNQPRGRLIVRELGMTIRVANILPIDVEGKGNRFIYPYFSEEPAINAEGARLGLFVLKEALANIDPLELRILDILRQQSFSLATHPFDGSEQELLLQLCAQLLRDRQHLKDGRGE